METSVFIARILGPACIVIGAGILFNLGFYQRVMEDFCKNTALVLYGGMMALIIGIVVVLVHNVWAANWTVLITIYGWGGVIKGVWLTVFPNSVNKFMRVYQTNKTLMVVHSGLVIVIGAVFTFFGYFAG